MDPGLFAGDFQSADPLQRSPAQQPKTGSDYAEDHAAAWNRRELEQQRDRGKNSSNALEIIQQE